MIILGIHIMTEQSWFEAIYNAEKKSTEAQRMLSKEIVAKLLHENLRMRSILSAIKPKRKGA